jgi:Fe(3+) dicitrate transport protein
MYSGMEGREWRKGSDERVNDFALKFRYALIITARCTAKLTTTTCCRARRAA